MSKAFDEKIPPTSSPTIYLAPPDIDMVRRLLPAPAHQISRRQFLRLAPGAATLPAFSRTAIGYGRAYMQTTSNQMVRATALFYGVLFLHCRPIIF